MRHRYRTVIAYIAWIGRIANGSVEIDYGVETSFIASNPVVDPSSCQGPRLSVVIWRDAVDERAISERCEGPTEQW